MDKFYGTGRLYLLLLRVVRFGLRNTRDQNGANFWASRTRSEMIKKCRISKTLYRAKLTNSAFKGLRNKLAKIGAKSEQEMRAKLKIKNVGIEPKKEIKKCRKWMFLKMSELTKAEKGAIDDEP